MSCFGINGCSNCMTFLFPCLSIRVRACADFIISMYLLMFFLYISVKEVQIRIQVHLIRDRLKLSLLWLQEYVDYYGSAGVQHIAMRSNDIISSVCFFPLANFMQCNPHLMSGLSLKKCSSHSLIDEGNECGSRASWLADVSHIHIFTVYSLCIVCVYYIPILDILLYWSNYQSPYTF